MRGKKKSYQNTLVIVVAYSHSLEISDTNKLDLQMSDKNSFWPVSICKELFSLWCFLLPRDSDEN